MRSFWSRTPMFRVAFAMIAGIGFEIGMDYWARSTCTAMALMALLLLFSIGFVLIFSRFKNVTLTYQLRLLNGVALNTVIISFAYMVLQR